jgi:hypothetical protein
MRLEAGAAEDRGRIKPNPSREGTDVALDQVSIDATGSRPALRDELSMLLLELGIAGLALAAAALLSLAR